MNRALVVLAAVATLGASSSSAQSTHPLAWMTGCWQTTRGTTVIEERWGDLVGGTMLGTSRTVRGGRVTGFEFSRVAVTGDSAEFHALPSGQAPAVFRGVLAPDSVLFTNPAHDFPTAIGYRPVGHDSLHAWISGGARRIEFPYARIPCEPPVRDEGSR